MGSLISLDPKQCLLGHFTDSKIDKFTTVSQQSLFTERKLLARTWIQALPLPLSISRLFMNTEVALPNTKRFGINGYNTLISVLPNLSLHRVLYAQSIQFTCPLCNPFRHVLQIDHTMLYSPTGSRGLDLHLHSMLSTFTGLKINFTVHHSISISFAIVSPLFT